VATRDCTREKKKVVAFSYVLTLVDVQPGGFFKTRANRNINGRLLFYCKSWLRFLWELRRVLGRGELYLIQIYPLYFLQSMNFYAFP
jgi:hypothetical protein